MRPTPESSTSENTGLFGCPQQNADGNAWTFTTPEVAALVLGYAEQYVSKS
jgi:hypothetical protein